MSNARLALSTGARLGPTLALLGAAALMGCAPLCPQGTLQSDDRCVPVAQDGAPDGGGRDGGPTDGGPDDGGALDSGVDRDAGSGALDADVPEDAGDPPPTVVFLSGSVSDGQTTNTSRAMFAFVANPAGSSVEYECQLASVTADGPTSTGFTACTSPAEYELLDAGQHTLSVRARNAGTTFGPAATRTWTLEALATGIRPIQEGIHLGTFDTETLVQVVARVQHDFAAAGSFRRTVAIADAGDRSVLADVAWHGIFTEPRDAEAAFPDGLTVTVTGTVREVDGNTQIQGATYARGAASAPYERFSTRDAADVLREELEGLVVDVGGFIPSNYNCSSCFGSPSGPNCLETCDGGCRPLRHRNLTSSREYGDDGFYTAALRDAPVRELWVFEFQEQNDACL